MKNIATAAVKNLLPTLKVLHRQEKIYLIQYLASELALQEEVSLNPNQSYAVWTPIDAYEASDILTKLLETHSDEQNTEN
jgi:hypothetical protein